MRPSIPLSLCLIGAVTAAVAADHSARMTQACILVYRAAPDAAAIIWSGGVDGRVVLYTAKGERIECSFATDGGNIPKLTSLQSTGADRSVAVLSGKALDKPNGLIAAHFEDAAGTSGGAVP